MREWKPDWVKRMAAQFGRRATHLREATAVLASKAVSFCWFFFIAVLLGQLGTVMIIFSAWWDQGAVSNAVASQVKSGNFIVFTTALLASSAYFLVKEYTRGERIDKSGLKSGLLLLSVLLGLAGTLIAFKLMVSDTALTPLQLFVHWAVYFLSLALAVALWTLEEQSSAKKFIKGISENAETITIAAGQSNTTTSGVKV